MKKIYPSIFTPMAIGKHIRKAFNTGRKAAAPYIKAAPAAIKAAATATQMLKTVLKTNTPRAGNSSISTVQQDVTQKFKSKKMPKTKKRKIAFAKKVIDATKTEQRFNLYTEVTNAPVYVNKTSAAGSVSEQYVGGDSPIYGINYGDLISPANKDLPYILGMVKNPQGAVTSTITTGAPFSGVTDYNDVYLGHQRFTLNLTNVTGYALIFDVYQFVAATDITSGFHKNPFQSWQTIAGNLPAYTNAVTPSIQGMTPLDVPEFGHYWKLTRKDRVYLNGNATCEISMTGLHKRKISRNELTNKYAMKGLTQYFLIVGGVGDDSQLPSGAVTAYPVHSSSTNKVWHFKTSGDGINGIDRPFQNWQLI